MRKFNLLPIYLWMQMIKMSAVTLHLLRFNLSSWYLFPFDNYFLRNGLVLPVHWKIPRFLDSYSFHCSHFTCRTLTKMQTGLAESLLKPLRLDWKSPKGTMSSLSTCLRVVIRKFKIKNEIIMKQFCGITISMYLFYLGKFMS